MKKKEQKYERLPHPAPVSEEEFIAHLEKTCSSKSIRQEILEYYHRLQKLDETLGKNLSYWTFDTYTDYEGNIRPTDPAKYLFAENMANVNPQTTIGKADYFRWQYLNMIDKVYHNKVLFTKSGHIWPLHKEISFSAELNPIAPTKHLRNRMKAFRQRVVFHELTHLMSYSSQEDGQWHELPSYTYNYDYSFIDNTTALSKKPKENKKIRKCLECGIEILEESATEYNMGVMLNDQHAVAAPEDYFRQKNSAYLRWAVLSPNSKTGKNYKFTGSYGEICPLWEMIFAFNGKDGNQVARDPSRLPTSAFFDELNKFFEDANLSPEFSKSLNKYLHKKLGLKKDVLEQPYTELTKFLLLTGRANQSTESMPEITRSILQLIVGQGLDTEPGRNSQAMQFAQAMILDIAGQKLAKQLHQIIAERKGNPLILQYKFKQLRHQASIIDGWVIKPNIPLNLRHGGNTLWARDEYSNQALATLTKNNPAIKAWGKYLEVLTQYCTVYAPKIVASSKFLTKEALYLEKIGQLPINLNIRENGIAHSQPQNFETMLTKRQTTKINQSEFTMDK